MGYTVGSYNLGPQHSIRIQQVTGPQAGQIVGLDGPRTKFTSKFEDELVKTSPIDEGGVVTGLRVPGGLSGSFEVEKGGDDFGSFMAFLDSYYFSSDSSQSNGQIYCVMTETVVKPDGSGSYSYQFQRVVFHGYERGTWERAGVVKPSVNFFASLVVPV